VSTANPVVVAAVRREVEAFTPVSAREVESHRRILAELEALADPFDRNAGPVHVTGSALVAGSRGTVLLVHRKLGIWLQPGGHLDAGEAPADAALRETVEETGLLVRHPGAGPYLVHLDVHQDAEDHTHLDLRYLLRCDTDADPAPPEGESQQVRWFSLDEALEVADEGLVDGLRRLVTISTEPGTGRPRRGY
jgi:8-oxo-dGTP pyrophosphatase MutT (NUDIX family)